MTIARGVSIKHCLVFLLASFVSKRTVLIAYIGIDFAGQRFIRDTKSIEDNIVFVKSDSIECNQTYVCTLIYASG